MCVLGTAHGDSRADEFLTSVDRILPSVRSSPLPSSHLRNARLVDVASLERPCRLRRPLSSPRSQNDILRKCVENWAIDAIN